MGLSEILKKIEEKSKQEADAIIAQAQRQAEQKIAEARRQAEEILKSRREEVRKKAAQVEAFARGRGQTRARHAIQKARGEIIDEVFEKVLQALKDLPAERYRGLLRDMIALHAAGYEEVVLDEADRERLGQDFPGLIRDMVRQRTGRDLTVRFEKMSLGGGFLLKSPGVKLDSTFPAILRNMRDSLELFLASYLFGVGDDGRV